ncbi:hypothetical protein NYO98_11685 [Nocardioides sp. STR2]|uniref:Uncharacterized protein n=1 Tax=Nocardioides pini TaxID=2975053 RepID=A0ABT4CFN9_9ACTN|nr:hypothetical protein [Nocardioides pini]MCY4726939.1 hypothetical protein [Nocardioides pini]
MPVSEVVGVYDADGGLLGEAAYVWGKVRGTRHCGLCDITHATVRRKREWDEMVATLPVPVRLLHLNELDDGLRAAVAATGAPVVLARDAGAWHQVVGARELDAMEGSVRALEAAVRLHLDEDRPA